LSTLTKILIVLLTIASIFLCGIMVTYVANADNYKQKYDKLYVDLQDAVQKRRGIETQLKEEIQKADQQKKELSDNIASLNLKIQQLEADFNEAQREKALLLQRVDVFAAEVATFTKTNQDQRALLENTIKTWKNVEADLIKEQSQHKETSRLLFEKIAIIRTLEEKDKRLLEENAELQTKLDQFLRQYGKVLAPATPVTPVTAKAKPAAPPIRDISLKGQITAVDLKNSLAEISIGTAHGVKEGMKFHVTRGDQFVCDIVILDVEPEKAIGWLELVQDEPKAGDIASTNL